MEQGGVPMTVIYVDSVFFLNGAMDYLLCLVTARLAGIPLRRKRYALAAVLGGAYAVAVFLPGCGFLACWPAKLAAGVLMALVAFGGEQYLLRLTLLLFALSCGLAGGVLGLSLLTGSTLPRANGIFYTDVNGKVLLAASAAAYLLVTVVFRAAARHGVRGERLAVRLSIGGRSTELTALWDSGNGLRDPTGGQPVLVTAPGSLDAVLPEEVRRLLTPELLRFPADLLEPLRRAAPELRPRLIPYRAVGTSTGLLLAVRTDWVEICGTRHPGVTAALSPTTLGTGYAALWGGDVRKGGDHETFDAHMAAAAGTAWTGPGHSLHRRKRYAAAAPDKGAGSGAVVPPGGRGRPQGADRA